MPYHVIVSSHLHEECALDCVHHVQPVDHPVVLLHLANVRDHQEETQTIPIDEIQKDPILLVLNQPCYRGSLIRQEGGETENILIRAYK